MNSRDLSQVVREAVQAVLAERGLLVLAGAAAARETSVRESASTTSPSSVSAESPAARVLVLLAGGAGDLGTVSLMLTSLASRFAIDLVLSPDFHERRGPWTAPPATTNLQVFDSPKTACMVKRLEGAKGLVLPLVSRPLAAKAALAMDDDMPSALLFQALRRGVPVFAAKSSADPDAFEATPIMIQGPNSVRALLEGYIKRLASWGVRWVPIEALAGEVAAQLGSTIASQTLDRPGGALAVLVGAASPTSSALSSSPRPGIRNFFTREDIWQSLERGEKEFLLGPNDVITLEAEEFAASRGIAIRRKG